MSEAKFSPAPWYCEKTTIYKLGKGGTNEFWCHLQAAGKEKAADEELMANAHLIAAAPELYGAAVKAIALLESIGMSGSDECQELFFATTKARG